MFAENLEIYRARKVWGQMMREGFDFARCTVERLMQGMGLARMIRGKPVRTTMSGKSASFPLDRVNRVLDTPASNRPWLCSQTSPMSAHGWASFTSPREMLRICADPIGAYACRIVGWGVSRAAHAGSMLDALEQALYARRPVHRGGMVHHSGRSLQYLSIR